MFSCAEQTEHNDVDGMWSPGLCRQLRLQYDIPVQMQRTLGPLIMYAAAYCNSKISKHCKIQRSVLSLKDRELSFFPLMFSQGEKNQ